MPEFLLTLNHYDLKLLPLTHVLTRKMTARSEFFARLGQYFNSHPHKEDDPIPMNHHHYLLHFNSHPRKENDLCLIWSYRRTDISTRILTRRMTYTGSSRGRCKNISTHILTRRMTLLLSQVLHRHIHFNSHPHKEDDHMVYHQLLPSQPFQLTSSQGG